MAQASLLAVHPVLASRDVDRSIEFYRSLGFDLAFADRPERPTYAGVRRNAVELHLQWHDESQWKEGVDRPVYRFVVDGVDELYVAMNAVDSLFEITPVADTAWGTREFHVRDPDGNGLQFYVDR